MLLSSINPVISPFNHSPMHLKPLTECEKWYKTTCDPRTHLGPGQKVRKNGNIIPRRTVFVVFVGVRETFWWLNFRALYQFQSWVITTRAAAVENSHVSVWGINSKFIQLQWDKHNLMHALYSQNKVTACDWWKFHRSACWGRAVKDHRCQPDAAPTSVLCHPLILILLKCNVPAEVTDHERTLESGPDLLGTQLSV